MRIISGKYKGCKILPPANMKLHPTTDFAKKGLFDILNFRVVFEGLKVLDLFSGTGFVSYEFASRGADVIVSVELNPVHAAFIKKIAKEFNMNLTVVKGDAFRYIDKAKQQFDIIFSDPPYDLQGIDKLPSLIFNNKILNNDGLLIIEHSKHINFRQYSEFLHQRSFGKVQFSFFSKNAEKYSFK